MLSRLLYSFLNFPYYIIYAAIFFLMVFFGEEVLLIVGALTRFDVLNFWAAVICAFLGTLAGDIFWYKLGAKYGEDFISRYGRWFLMTPQRFKALENIITKNGGLFIFLSKFMYNMNHISEVAAGVVKFNFKKYLRYQIPVSAVWTLALVSLGYFFADNLATLKHNVTLLTIALLLVFIAFILFERLIEKLIEKKWIN